MPLTSTSTKSPGGRLHSRATVCEEWGGGLPQINEVGVGRSGAWKGKAGHQQARATIYSDDSLGTYATLS